MESAEAKGLLWNFDGGSDGVVEEGTASHFRAELVSSWEGLTDAERPPEVNGWLGGVSERKKGQGYMDWMDMSIEEYDEAKKASKHKSILDALPKHMRVPSRWAPGFWPTLLVGLLVIVHALLSLLQHWVVRFDVLMNYSPCGESEGGTHVLLRVAGKSASASGLAGGEAKVAAPPSEKALLVPLERRITGPGGADDFLPSFQYHRRTFVYDYQSETWMKVRANTSMSTSIFTNWKGLNTPEVVSKAQSLYGKNETDVAMPTFLELYAKQLLSPFTVFQLFCVCLWMLDGMWQYSLFTLFMIFMFEGTVVFSRLKSMGALKGMAGGGAEPRSIHVHRQNKWARQPVSELVPGDVVSVTRPAPAKDSDEKGKRQQAANELIPADLLLLGRNVSVVVNEASLTGESVPQMKEGLTDFGGDAELEMMGEHKMNVVYGGTKIMQIKKNESKENSADGEDGGSGLAFLLPPDGGAPAFVLRTGFLSSQGKLVRMIEGGQTDQSKGHERDTALLLLLLFVFALISSGYVLVKGMETEGRSKYELLLHCILILTSVIPPELPMQMALAVNQSLMTLMKMQIFCTEPFRVPVAGRVGCCLFDKTGTLTTDELVAVGVCSGASKKNTKHVDSLHPMTKLPAPAQLVLASCHSLVLIDGKVNGDPLELASLEAMRWTVNDESGSVGPKSKSEKREAGKILVMDGKTAGGLRIMGRHHFSSKLQRMSAVVSDSRGSQHYAVCKGSPEAVGARLMNKPEGYEDTSRRLSKRGYRVIALSYRPLKKEDTNKAVESRTVCEDGGHMIFAGFVAFTCRVRKDTKEVLTQLTEGGMNVIMVTGDALLTAAHVAKEVAICEPDEDMINKSSNSNATAEVQKLLFSKKSVEQRKSIIILERGEEAGMYWQSYDDESHVVDFVASEVPKLYERYDLAVTGKNLAAAVEYDEGVKKVLWYFKIFARMSPTDKELVINCLHSMGHLSMMCGDGANDVGALKSSDVGVALLSGFGDVNVDKGEDGVKKDDAGDSSNAVNETALITQDKMDELRRQPVRVLKAKLRELGTEPDNYPDLTEKEDLVQLYRIKAREDAVKKHDKKNALDKMKAKKSGAKTKAKEDMAEKQKRLQIRIKELEAQGDTWASVTAMKEFWSAEAAEKKKMGQKMRKNNSIEGSAAQLAAQFEDLEMEELPIVQIGDASIAAPFTSKMPSIRSCVDIIRQGRCTLVTSIQMYQILALNCLISAYSLSVLYLDGVKYGDTQMTCSGILGSVAYMSVSRSKPLNRLSAVKPLPSIFHPALFLSLLGQFTTHLVTMMVAVRSAKAHLPEDYEPDIDGQFHPGILNSVVFLVSNVQQVTVFVVNLQGRPFMTGLTENRPLLWSLLASFILTFMFASESLPNLNKYFQLVSFPDEAYRNFILTILVLDVVVSFCFDRLMKFIFAPDILMESIKGTTKKDLFLIIRTFVFIGIGMHVLLGDDTQWETLLEEEEALAAMMAGNVTDVIAETIDSVAAEL